MFKPIEIFDVVDKEYQNQIYNYVTDVKFPWHFLGDTTFEYATNDPQTSTPGFVNLIYHPNNDVNPHLDFFMPLLNQCLDKAGFKLVNLLRMRMGFLLNTKYVFPSLPYKYNNPHRDFDQEHYTLVYYVNKSDGDTVVFKELEQSEKYNILHRSTPDQGKMVMFNGWHYHASTCPKMFTKRIALTINFTAEKNG
jgi:hypothetical protein